MDGSKWILGDVMKIRLDHIGIAVNNLDEGEKFWKLLGLIPSDEDEEVSDQGVITRFIPISNDKQKPAMIELLEPTGEDTPIGKFCTTSLIIPAKNTKPYPILSGFFKIQ